MSQRREQKGQQTRWIMGDKNRTDLAEDFSDSATNEMRDKNRIDFVEDFSGSATKEMASELSIASPRRTLSVSRERASVFIVGEGEGDRTKQGAKPAEVYGFVGSISTIVGAVLLFGWAYLPESWLCSMGITYYPSRYWAVALPAYAMMLIVFICVAYTSLNYISTIPPDSWYSLCDDFTRDPVTFCSNDGLQNERPIDPISDISIIQVNLMMFGSQ